MFKGIHDKPSCLHRTTPHSNRNSPLPRSNFSYSQRIISLQHGRQSIHGLGTAGVASVSAVLRDLPNPDHPARLSREQTGKIYREYSP